ncbi:MAG: hypothetical protein IRZ00_15200 [Gemmatimonadetes bacterium]|nr:hypothetical protein [Gemmatimonadota bacterium]
MRYEIEYRDHDLAQGGRRIELVGSPRSLVWPNICPNCGQPASERVRVRKIFRRSQGTRAAGRGWVWGYVIRSAEIPLCRECAERHRREETRPSTVRVLGHFLLNPLMIPVVGGAVFARVALEAGARSVGVRPPWWISVGLPGLLTFASAWSLLLAWRSTRFIRIPTRTQIVRACDFSDNLGNLLVGERHVYAIRNATFADAFLAANAARVFTAERRARAERTQLIAGTLLLGTLLVVGLLVYLGVL